MLLFWFLEKALAFETDTTYALAEGRLGRRRLSVHERGHARLGGRNQSQPVEQPTLVRLMMLEQRLEHES